MTQSTSNRLVTEARVTVFADAAGAAAAVQATTTTLLAAKADLVGGVIPSAQIPAIALTNAVTVANQAAMLALTTTQVQPGDVAVRTDGAGTFILTATDPTQLANWIRLNAPTDLVTSVNGYQGTVVLAASDVGLGNVNNTPDATKPVSTAQATAIGAVTLSGPANALTTTGTLVGGRPNTVDATSGAFTATLPNPSTVGQLLAVEKIDTTANIVTISGTIRSASTTMQLLGTGIAYESLLFEAESLTSWRPVAGHKPKTWLDALYDAKGAAAAVTPTTLGLGNVNNTADSAKPVSTAQLAALNLKALLNDPLGLGYVATFAGMAREANVVAFTATDCRYARVLAGGTISSIGLQIGTSSGNICVAVYRASGTGRSAVPGTLLASSGSVACPAAGYQTVALGSSVTLNVGDFIGFSVDNATATFVGISGSSSNLYNGQYYGQNTTFPCPTTPGTLFGTSKLPIFVGV